VKKLYNVGIFTAGIAVIIFGTLDQIPGHYTFTGAAFACRIIEASGTYAFFTASFAVIAVEFPNNIATTFAAMESCFGIGMICGPVVSFFPSNKDLDPSPKKLYSILRDNSLMFRFCYQV
jgi:MFS family permease